MAINAPEACALHLRSLLMCDFETSRCYAANLVDAALMELRAHIAPESIEEIAARKLSLDLRNFFLGPAPVTDDAAVRKRHDFTTRVELLHQAVVRQAAA
jgi:hypothetical protein